ncbi:IS30 family transposase [Weissella bombi]|nr:IS30 family transposase [Weissella bombi]
MTQKTQALIVPDGRTTKTIYDEVNHNRRRPDITLAKFPYEPEYANWLAAQKRKYRKLGKIQTKPGALKRIKTAIDDKKWTIPMIANKVAGAPSEPTLYRYLKKGIDELANYQKAKYHVKRPSLRAIMRSNHESDFMREHSIDQRPEYIIQRKKYDHWEMDCIDSIKGVKASILVFLERKTRYIELYKINSKNSPQIRLATEQFLERHVDEVKSITTDRGHAFTNFDVMSLISKHQVNMYFTHAYKSI